jgi:hypothetical protein
MAQTPPLMKQYSNSTEDVKISFPPRETFREQYEKQNSVNRVGRPFTKYYIEVKQFSTTANIPSDCSSITFINYGSNNVDLNGVILTQGQQLTIEGNVNEIDTTIYQARFSTSISVNNSITVIRKLYV